MSDMSRTPTLRFIPTYPDPKFSIRQRVSKKDAIRCSFDTTDTFHVASCSWNTLEAEWMYVIENCEKFPAAVIKDIRESYLQSDD